MKSDPTIQAYQNATYHVEPTPELTTYGGIKLGWVQGVLIPCLLNIWGVMLFLRIAWMVAQAGIGLTIVIIVLSGIVCIITTLSLSALCTNGQIQGGGVYYLVSRSLGAELGASVGIVFAFANAVAASMNTIGFCESLNELLKSYNVKIFDNGVNDIRIVGAVALFVMCIICAVGMDWETRTQNFLITVIVLSIANYVLGAILGPRSDIDEAEGFAGISWELAKENWLPDFRFSEGQQHSFFSVFAMYFPAVTGVQAGANICGDLKDPATAIPKGTLLALAISITSYLAVAVLSGVGALRDASGKVDDLATPDAIDSCNPNCEYGLHNNYKIMHLMAFWGPMIYYGCWAATLSTALTNLLSVPRLIQALGIDRIYPGLIYFSKPFGKHGEPYRGYVLTFAVSLLFLLIADLNTIAPLITNFYLASYALINFCTFHAAFVHPISWRPTFRYYNWWLSMIGCGLCVIMMMIISWVMALVTTFIFITLYLLVLYRKPDANWGSSTDAQRYHETIASILQISQREEHVKSYNPQVLVLAGKPYARPALLDVAHMITWIGSFMVVADISTAKMKAIDRKERRSLGEEWLWSRKERAFYVLMHGFARDQALAGILQASGLGRVAPNIMLLGYKYNWAKCPHQDLLGYVRMIQLAFEYHLAVAVLRVRGGMGPDPSGASAQPAAPGPGEARGQAELRAVMHPDSDAEVRGRRDDDDDDSDERQGLLSEKAEDERDIPLGPSADYLSEVAVHKMRTYRRLVFNKSSTLDAWWLYYDGGMNILLPYIIAHRGKHQLTFRIFALTKARQNIEDAETNMRRLLKKLRINYSHLTLVTGIDEPPTQDSWDLFQQLLENHTTNERSDILVSSSELKEQEFKTRRHLRLRELLIEHSSDANFIVMTLPLPRKGAVSAALYLTWLEVMSRDMPPMLFVRGNKTTVIDA